MSFEELVMALRGLVVRALVRRTVDTGGVQAVDVTTHEGINRDGIPVLQPYGLATHPPQGSTTIVLMLGGDQGAGVALPAGAPHARFGNLAPGETVLYNAGGARVALRDGVVEVHAATIVEIRAATRVTVFAPELRVEGNIVATGSISDANGSMQEMRDSYNAHTHGGGPGPSPTMT